MKAKTEESNLKALVVSILNDDTIWNGVAITLDEAERVQCIATIRGEFQGLFTQINARLDNLEVLLSASTKTKTKK